MDQTVLRMGTSRARWVLLTTVLGSGMALLDGTVVNVALKQIGVDFKASFDELQWTVNAYTLTLAALILVGGSLGDRLGRRRIFVIGIIWFAVASLCCGLAPNAGTLIAARAFQGIGGALLTPGSLAIISATFTGADRAKAIGAWSGLGGIAGAVGPFVGGWLVQWNWRAVFLINLPIAIATAIVAVRYVPESKDPQAATQNDIPGIVLTVLGLGTLTYALTTAGKAGASPLVISLGIIGVVALTLFVVVERRSRHPLVPMETFRNKQFSAANAVTLLVYAALGVLILLLVLQLQVVAGFSPLAAGVALLPVTVLMLLLSSRAGALSQKIGPRLPMTLGPVVAAIGLLLLLRIGANASYWFDVLPAVVVFGLGLCLIVAPLTSTVLNAAEDRYAGVASGINNAVARAAGLLSVAVVPAAAGIAGNDYTNPIAFHAAFQKAMLICVGLMLVGAALAFVFIKNPVKGDAKANPSHTRLDMETCMQCNISAPALHPEDQQSPSSDLN